MSFSTGPGPRDGLVSSGALGYHHYRVGLGHVGSYQASAMPFASSSIIVPAYEDDPIEISFPGITKFVTVTNMATGTHGVGIGLTHSASGETQRADARKLRIGFSSHGTQGISQEAGIADRFINNAPLNSVPNYYFILHPGESYTAEWRVSSVFLNGDRHPIPNTDALGTTASVVAGITQIHPSALTGRLKNWSGSVGVG